MKKAISVIASAALLLSLSACAEPETVSETPAPTAEELRASAAVSLDPDMFTSRDKSTVYDAATAQTIDLDGRSGDVTLSEEGEYIIKGTLTDGRLIINAAEDAKLHLIFDGVHIASQSAAALYIVSADKVFITLAEGSENGLSAAGAAAPDDYANVDAALFSRADLSLNGSGTLSVSSAQGHGIVSKDDLVFCGGSYVIQAALHGVSGQNSIRIADGSFVVTAGKNCLDSEHENAEKGFIYIAGGDFDLSSGNDACHCSGAFDFLAGSMNISAADDGIHGDAALSVSGGSISISLCYEGLEGVTVDISGGEIDITASDDGINAASGSSDSAGDDKMPESRGNMRQGAPDMNNMNNMQRPDMGGTLPEMPDAADRPGAPQGMNENDPFAADSECSVRISGGVVRINAQGDGIDSNGSLSISGGELYISGPRSGGDGALDYDGSGIISGGIVVACDMGGMSQSFSEGAQCSALIQLSGSGTIRLLDADGTELISYSPAGDYSTIIVSCPAMTEGGEYTLYYGKAAQSFSLSTAHYGSAQGMGGPGGMRRP